MSDQPSVEQSMNEMSRFRLFLAIVVPGFVAGLVISTVYLLLHPGIAESTMLSTSDQVDPIPPSLTQIVMANLTLLGLGVLIGGLWGMLPMILLALPAHAFLIRRSRAVAWMYVVSGLAIGAVSAAIMYAPVIVSPYNSASEMIEMMCLCVVGGAASGLTFWLIRRPDRDAPAAPLS